VICTALAFAGYHYLGEERFYWPTFAFRVVAGAYFGLVFVFRGFGITAGSHAGYDCVLVLMRLIPLR